MPYNKYFFAVSLLIFTAAWCFGQTDFTTGENLFMENKPDEAVVHLENTIATDPDHVMAFLYLGIVYEQLGRADDAIAVYQRILDRAGDLTATIANNLGNAYFKAGKDTEAEAAYTQALTADTSFASAYLGRANTRLRAGSMRNAAADYGQYLQLEPDTTQREAIEQVLAAIQADFPEPEPQQPFLKEILGSAESAIGGDDE